MRCPSQSVDECRELKRLLARHDGLMDEYERTVKAFEFIPLKDRLAALDGCRKLLRRAQASLSAVKIHKDSHRCCLQRNTTALLNKSCVSAAS